MKNPILEKTAEMLNLPYDTMAEAVYGTQGGYPFCITAVGQTKILSIVFSVRRAAGELSKEELRAFSKENSGVQGTSNKGNRLEVVVKNGVTAKKIAENAQQALEASVALLTAQSFTAVCQTCGSSEQLAPSNIGGKVQFLCDTCHADVVNKQQNGQEVEENTDENVLTGFLGALVGSLIGLVALVIVARLGYVAILPGIVMGLCTVFGYEKMGHKLSIKGILICVALMLVMVYLANQLDWAFLIASEFDVSLPEAFPAVMEIVELADAMNTYLGNLLLMYLFTALGAIPMMIGALRGRKQKFLAYRLGQSAALPQENEK